MPYQSKSLVSVEFYFYSDDLCMRLEKVLSDSGIGFTLIGDKNPKSEEAKYTVNSLPSGSIGFLWNPKGFYDYFG